MQINDVANLTGTDLALREVAHVADLSGIRKEGNQIWIYSIPKEKAQVLASKDYPLSQYPSWSGLSLDGYKQQKWVESKSDSVQWMLKQVLSETSTLDNDFKVRSDMTMKEARNFAFELSNREGTFVAFWWYSIGDDEQWLHKYFLYLLNPEKGIMIKMSQSS